MKKECFSIVFIALVVIATSTFAQRGKDGDMVISVPGMTEWTFDTNLEGWLMTNNLSGNVAAGILNLTVTGNDPQMHSPSNLNINANSLKYIVIRMKNNTPDNFGQLYWTRSDDPNWETNGKVYNFSLFLSHVGYHEYLIDLTDVPAWKDIVTQLRIDPTNRYSSGSFEIDYIRVISYSVVNEYTYLTANANAGDALINVNNSGLNFNNRFGYGLETGDLCLIMQMQGASIKGGVEDESWGEVLSLNNSGNYEFKEVYAVLSSTQIEFTCGLEHDYTANGKVQVVRVPRYNNLIVETGSPLTSQYWDGRVGGILAIEALNDINIENETSINVTGRGFRGGILDRQSNDFHDYTMAYFATLNAGGGGAKGESIAGFFYEYDALGGRYGRGAPANGGGGGVSHNAGGGGGANAGDINNYTGLGNPDLNNPAWAQAWNLEGANFANSTSSGGGRGGYSYSTLDEDALTVPPGDARWGGNRRNEVGGRGGRPIDYSSGRIFLGGGGGAGDGNNEACTDGADGGGIIYLISYGGINGQGDIMANGMNGTTTPPNGNDAPGGGGGGGTIVLNCMGAITGVTAEARGGYGGCQVIETYYPPGHIDENETEGAGGGGGGGYIALTTPGIATDVSGARNGLTDQSALSEFPPNGATTGGDGVVGEVTLFDLTTTDDTICTNNSGQLKASTIGTAPSSLTPQWYDAFSGGRMVATGSLWNTPVLTADQTYFVQTCPGSFRVPATIVVVVPMANAGNDLYLCSGDTTNLKATGVGTYLWNTGSSSNQITISPSVTTTYTVTASNLGCSESDDVVVYIDQINVSVTPHAICEGDTGVISAYGFTNYTWADGRTTSELHVAPTITTTYSVSGTTGVCSDEIEVVLSVNPLPDADAGPDFNICKGVSIVASGTGGDNYLWSNGSTMANISLLPLSTSTYTLTVSTPEGCTDIDSMTVQVNDYANANAGPDDTICRGTTSGLVASGGSSFIWNVGANTAAISVSPVSTTTYIVTVDNGPGCTDKDSVIVYVFPQDTAYAGPNDTICQGDQSVINGMGSGSILWSNGETSLSFTVSPTVTTTYTLMITDELKCPDQDEVVIFVSPLPVIFGGDDNSICIGGVSTSLSAQGGETYLWNTAETTEHIQVTPVITTTYSVSGTSDFGCTGSDDVVVVVNENPTPDAGSNQDMCLGETITANASGGLNFIWSNSVTSQQLTVSPNITTTYMVTAFDSNGCTGLDSMVVIVHPVPTATTDPDTTVCYDTPVAFSAYGGGTYTWSIGEQTQTVSILNTVETQTYVVTVTDGNGCTDTERIVLHVLEKPNIQINEPEGICIGDTTTLTISENIKYSWSTGDTNAYTLILPTVTSTYSITGTDEMGCTGTDDVVIQVNPLPIANAGEDVEICQGEEVSFIASGGEFYLWSTLVARDRISVKPDTNTQYVVSATDANGCKDIDSVVVIVHPNPVADFYYTPQHPSMTEHLVSFRDSSEGEIATWSWIFGDLDLVDNESSEQNPEHTYNRPGNVLVRLAVQTIHGCLDTVNKPLVITSNFTFYAPNAYTPNFDNINDGFRTYGQGFDTTTFALWIYSRWGELIFTSNDLYEFWDGRKQGHNEACHIGVYSWVAYFRDYEGNPYRYVGKVALVK